jgi:hypothetical protein
VLDGLLKLKSEVLGFEFSGALKLEVLFVRQYHQAVAEHVDLGCLEIKLNALLDNILDRYEVDPLLVLLVYRLPA